MKELKERCIINDELISKYKFNFPVSETTTSSYEIPSSSHSSTARGDIYLQSATTTTETTTDMSTMDSVKFKESGQIMVTTTLMQEELSTSCTSNVRRNLFPPSPTTGTDIQAVDILQLGETKLPEQEDEEDDTRRLITMNILEEKRMAETGEEIPIDVSQTEPTKPKQHYCPYCRNLYSQFARHIFQVHSGEKVIELISKLPPNHKERKRVIASLRAKGARIYNVLESSPHLWIVPRRKVNMKKDSYIACHMCGHMYKTKFLYRHVKKCPNSVGSARGALRMAVSAKYKDDEESESAIQFSRDVVSGITKGEVKRTIEDDPLLIKYGRYLCEYYSHDTHLVNLIRRKLRYVAEVFIEVKKLDNDIEILADVFQPKKIHTIFKAIKTATGYEKGYFKKPAMAIDMSPILQQCARRLINEATECDNEEKIKILSRWVELFKSEYNVTIAKQARRTLDEKKWNKPRTLPLTEDIFKLNKHVKYTIEHANKQLKKEFNYNEWENLNKATMVQIVTFNRKRVGDVQRMKLEDFNKAHNIQKESTTYALLSESEKIISSQYMRVEVRGKHAKVVPILFTKEMMRNIAQIIAMRKQACIPPSNPFVFAKQKDVPFEVSRSLTQFAYACGAERPTLLTGTKMRKHIATVSQAFNFSQNDLSILAGYLGHTVQTHSQFYRLPDEATQLGKISKVLQAVDVGKINELKGKSLDELEVLINTMDSEAEKQDTIAEGFEAQGTPRTNSKTPKKPMRIIRRTWTTPERMVMKKIFRDHLITKTLPTPMECNEARNRYSPIKCRTVAQIKAWVNNERIRLLKIKTRT